jgi:hypothetical protein
MFIWSPGNTKEYQTKGLINVYGELGGQARWAKMTSPIGKLAELAYHKTKK